MACSHIQSCELFVQFALNPALDIWKRHYCEGDFESCARFQMSKSGRQIPLTLLPNGATITHRETGADATGTAAIFNAIAKNRLKMIQSLARIGVDLNCTNIEGQTPLMAAAAHGHLEIVQFLLDRGVDVTATNDFGQSALDLATQAGHGEIARLLQERGAAATESAA